MLEKKTTMQKRERKGSQNIDFAMQQTGIQITEAPQEKRRA